MIDQHLKDLLLEAGFDASSIQIYLTLAEKGELSVKKIASATAFSRTTVHTVLLELLVKELVLYRKEGRNAYYSANHPSTLYALLENKKRELSRFETQFELAINTLTGIYNIGNNRPGVRFFEGVEGFRECLRDSLSSKETILTYVDPRAFPPLLDEVNQKYALERREKNLSKKILIPNTFENTQYLKKQGKTATDVRLLPDSLGKFAIGMQIYDGKIAYFTLREKNTISVLIEDPLIYQMQKMLFEYMWGQGKTLLI